MGPGAVVSMRVEDYYPLDKRWWVRLHEKGGKRHEMPAHHNLEAYLDAYIDATGIREEKKTPLFRSAAGRTGTLTSTVMNRVDAWRMVQRRTNAWLAKTPRTGIDETSIVCRSLKDLACPFDLFRRQDRPGASFFTLSKRKGTPPSFKLKR